MLVKDCAKFAKFAMRTRGSTVLGSLDVGSRVVGRGGRRTQVPAEKGVIIRYNSTFGYESY
jgi:hypothetical protein